MKNFIVTLCFASAALTLAACETASSTSGNVDTQAPYSTERTASSGDVAVQPAEAERVFKSYQSK
jgi:hypothetical protein